MNSSERDTVKQSAKNWGVIMYVIAALASIAMPLVLTVAPRNAASLFPQATYEDVVRLIHSTHP
jgi:hypothetical protein